MAIPPQFLTSPTLPTTQEANPYDLFERFADLKPLHQLDSSAMLDRILIARSERAQRMVDRAHLRATSEQRAAKPRTSSTKRVAKVKDPLAAAKKTLMSLPPEIREAILSSLMNKGA